MAALIDILLATYEGEKYLREQVESIINQDFCDWRLLVRDDGSVDETCSILSEFAERYPGKVVIINDELGRLGPAKSFEQLAFHSTAPYIAFSDQDDVWQHNKLQLELSAIRQVEKSSNEPDAVLVHSDLQVMNEDMSVLANSFWSYQNYNPQKMYKLNCLLTQNYVTGCTMLINRQLLDIALPFPAAVIMHDWWLALVACINGQIVEVNSKTVLYRQHDRNENGAQKSGLSYIARKLKQGIDEQQQSLIRTCYQARALLNMNELPAKDAFLIGHYVSMYELNWFHRRLVMIRMRFLKYGIVRKIAMFFLL